MESLEEGIEASDLASLLYRFEEAVTPPATPTPTSIQANSLLKVVAKDLNTSASKTDVTASQLRVKPRAIYASNKPGISLLPFTLPSQTRTFTSLSQSPNIVIRASVPPRQTHIVDRGLNGYAGSAVKIIPATQVVTPLLLVQPASQASVVKPLAKHASLGAAFKPIKRSTSALALNAVPSTTVTSTSGSLLQSMLLDKDSCIIPKRGTAKKTGKIQVNRAGTVSSSITGAVPTDISAFSLPTTVTKKAAPSVIALKHVPTGLSQSLPSSPTSFKAASWPVKEADHDYCSNKSQSSAQFINTQSASANLESTTNNKESAAGQENKKSFPVEEARTVSSLDAELLQDLEYLDEHFGPLSPLVNTTDDNVLEDGEVLVDEDGNDCFPQLVPSAANHFTDRSNPDFDTSGNSETMPYYNGTGSTVAFNLAGEDASFRRKGRRYRRRTELNTSPIREDKTEFFDKIPAFYTALSIPTKPTKMSVFATATQSLGSTDHLQPDDTIPEHGDPGLYDKVPAHRRCFTNTAKELELSTAHPPEEQSQQPVASSSQYPMSSSLLSSSSTELNPEGSSSPRRARSRSRRRRRRRHLSSCSGSSDHQSRPVSQTGSRSHSRERLLKSRSRSRSGSCSSRSCSTCSSYSSNSCGSSCSGCARSRSRSCSTCSSSSSSRSRSRSPQTKRDWQMRNRNADHMPRNRHLHTDRSRGRASRSISPAERAGWRSRSRSQRRHTHSRSSVVDERAAQKKKAREEEKIRAMEERRVVYVGKIPENFTKRQLHQRFQCFGEIKEVKLNFREHGDNYGFVTFAYACDAIAAKEKGNNIEGAQKFDLCFGGRRRFCPDQYADLDGNREIEEEYAPVPKSMSGELDYAALLKQHSSQQRRGGKL
ncbi:hypothetical protein EGW08_007666 [Elysia chlorotica]|uniref:RRM domain-containing protein n=1 Tax=Elysia chlorotica TaxID=188477 RepID=A0A433TSQ8_ELYCH|nr:hypothetical protein EGW08_007666 [Elysia chlorotica]